MMMGTPHPVSDKSSPEALSPFCGNQDDEPNPLLAKYKQLCPGGLNEGAVKEDASAVEQARTAKQPAGSVAEATTDAMAEEEQGKKKTKKQRWKGSSRFKPPPKGKHHGSAHVPVSDDKRKRRRRKVVPAVYREVDYQVIPEREMRDCISSYYLAVMGAPPQEEWCGKGGTVRGLLALSA